MPVSAANVPGSQLVHVESQTPVASLNVPTAHSLQDPALASSHWVRNLPLLQAAQASHDAWPVLLWKRPVPQFVQVESQFAAVALNLPAAHFEHVPAAELAQPESTWPAVHGLQSLHEILPSSFWYSPVAQASHSDAFPSDAKRPVAQSVQVSVYDV